MWTINRINLPYGLNDFILCLLCILAKGKPSSPGKPAASDIKATQMKVSWTPPDFDGGNSIIGYLLEYKEKTSTDWIHVNVNQSTAVVKNLDEDTEYQFRVSAENEVNLSDVSTLSDVYKTLGMSFNMFTLLIHFRR